MGLLYRAVRPVARFVLARFYRQIDITGLENIPDQGAVILAANHPTAFIEPCVLACFQRRRLHFLARGDLFRNTLATLALRALNILPVYRIQDGGYGKLRNNFETFDACFEVLSRGRALMILAEGNCVHERKLRPLRKGTARIALGALAADVTLREVHVVPVGVNFTAADQARSGILIRCGEPIAASDWLDAYRENPTPALADFTRHLRQRLSPLVVQIPQGRPAVVGELQLQVAGFDRPGGTGVTHDGAQLNRALTLIEEPADEPVAQRLASLLYLHRTSVGAVAGAMNGRRSEVWVDRPGQHLVKLMVAALLQLLLIPILLVATYIANVKVNHIEFNQPVHFAAIAIGLFVIVPISLVLLPWLYKIWVVVSLLTCGWSLRALDKWRAYLRIRHFQRLVPKVQREIKDLYATMVGAQKT